MPIRHSLLSICEIADQYRMGDSGDEGKKRM